MFKPAINLTDDLRFIACQLYTRCKCGLCPAQQCRQHLTCLVAVIINCLLATDHQPWGFFINHRLQQLGDGQRLNILIGFNMNAAISTHRQASADGFLSLCRAYRHQNNLISLTSFFDAQGLLYRDFIKRVHRHFYICQFNTRLVWFDTDFDVVINDPFYRYQNFHVLILFFTSTDKPDMFVSRSFQNVHHQSAWLSPGTHRTSLSPSPLA